MGVELDQGGGDNSGSHSGVRYFNCRPSHGVFLPPSKVKRSVKITIIYDNVYVSVWLYGTFSVILAYTRLYVHAVEPL